MRTDALRTFALTPLAQKILRWAIRDGRQEFTLRNAYSIFPKNGIEAVDKAIQELIRSGYFASKSVDRPGPGRKPSPAYTLIEPPTKDIAEKTPRRHTSDGNTACASCGQHNETEPLLCISCSTWLVESLVAGRLRSDRVPIS